METLSMKEFLKRHKFSLSFLVVLLVSLYFLQPEPGTAAIHEFGGATMGTTYSVKVVDDRESASGELLALEIGELLKSLDREVMSTYSEDSELTEINKAAINEKLVLSGAMNEVLSLALDVNALTDGAFDVTVGPLVNRWGFGPEQRHESRIPDQAEIDTLRARIGSEYLDLDSSASTLVKRTDVYIDLSGIAKGYAVDQLAHYLDGRGYSSYFIEVGGELRIKGYKPGEQTWVPAIETPVDTAPQVHNIFYPKGESIAVAGSGDYRNYFDLDGVHYSHEIDPETGRPVTHNLAAVYVIDASAARADALATAFMVLGTQRAFALAQRVGLAAYFISKREGQEGFDDLYTSQFAHYLSPN
jgi:thiamine biosynthesis lipoprotein